MSRPREFEQVVKVAPFHYKNADEFRIALREKRIGVTREADEMLELVEFREQVSEQRIALKVVHSLSVQTAGDQLLRLKNGAQRTVVYEAAVREGLKLVFADTFLGMCVQYRDALEGMPYAGMDPLLNCGYPSLFGFVSRRTGERSFNDLPTLVMKDGKANHTFHAKCLVAFIQP